MQALYLLIVSLLFVASTLQAPIPLMKRGSGLITPYQAFKKQQQKQNTPTTTAPVTTEPAVVSTAPTFLIPETSSTTNAETATVASVEVNNEVAYKGNANVDSSSQTSSEASGRFWGVNYTPYRSDGACGTYEQVVTDLQALSGVASNIRLYSVDCGQFENVMRAVTENNLPLTVYPGIWVSEGEQRFTSELDIFITVLKKYQSSNKISGISVGNEELFKGSTSESAMIDYIRRTKERLSQEGISGMQVYTTETDGNLTENLAGACDLIQVNIYTNFDATFNSIEESADLAIKRAVSAKAKFASGSKYFRIGESGWPSQGGAKENLTNSQAYAQRFTCKANSEGIDAFYFEAKDSLWKKNASSVEQSFGIFSADLTRKFPLGGIGGRC